MDAGASWGGQGGNNHESPGAQVHVDFQQYLDLGMPGLGDESFGYEDFNAQSHQQNEQMMRQDGMDLGGGNHMAHLGQKQGMMQGHQMAAQGSQQHQSSPNGQQMENQGSNHGRNNSINELDAQIQYLQAQRQQQQQRLVLEQQQNYYAHQNTRIIPPTPNSMEMHARDRQQYGHGNGQDHDMQQGFMYDGTQVQMRHDLAFTPLVSPAVTPLDTHFHIPDYSMPGAFFSPLTSPALHAENGYNALYAPSHPLSSVGTSPTEMSLDLLPLPASQGGIARKLSGQQQQRNAAGKAPSKPRASRAVRQSPIVKPLNSRRKPTITSISPETLSELVEPALVDSRTPSSHASSQHGDSLTCSPNKGSDSISPEALSDMAPPPLPAPRSVKGSPFLMPQNSSHPRVQQLIASNIPIPATPASLMKIARETNSTGVQASPILEMSIDEDQFMEGFSLPEPAADEAAMVMDDQTTPTVERERTPLALAELPPPAVTQMPLPPTATVKPSPSTKPQPSSASSHSTPSLRKTPKLAARGSQPRHGSCSVHASPALLPRISPSIKPQNSQQRHSLADDTAQLLLTTKSNYQNILEGNHLPGVSYPSELSTNLTSKRTSHKIAEQGRRNRINVALQEIATLLPVNKGGKPTSGGDEDKDEGTGSGGGGPPGGGKGTSAGSKASTVEQAIEYIKKLKEEVEAANRRAEEAEKRLMEKAGGEGQE